MRRVPGCLCRPEVAPFVPPCLDNHRDRGDRLLVLEDNCLPESGRRGLCLLQQEVPVPRERQANRRDPCRRQLLPPAAK